MWECGKGSEKRQKRAEQKLEIRFLTLSHCCVKRRFGVLVYCVVFGCTTTDGCGRSLHFFPKCMRT